MTEGLNRLHVRDVAITELFDDALLIYERFVGIEVENAGTLVLLLPDTIIEQARVRLSSALLKR